MRRGKAGFTLIEAIMSLVIVSLTAAVVAAMYTGGMNNLNFQRRQAEINALLQSELDVLLSTRFESLANGTRTVLIEGTSETLAWSAASVDLNGDGVAEPDVKEIRLTLANKTIALLATEHYGRIRKL